MLASGVQIELCTWGGEPMSTACAAPSSCSSHTRARGAACVMCCRVACAASRTASLYGFSRDASSCVATPANHTAHVLCCTCQGQSCLLHLHISDHTDDQIDLAGCTPRLCLTVALQAPRQRPQWSRAPQRCRGGAVSQQGLCQHSPWSCMNPSSWSGRAASTSAAICHAARASCESGRGSVPSPSCACENAHQPSGADC